MYATAGNLSLLDPQSGLMWITSSGKDKSSLTEKDFITLNFSSGEIIGETENRPSAETIIHRTIYSLFKTSGACLHVHTPSSCILDFGLSRSNPYKRVALPNSEIIKAFGNFTEEPNLSLIVIHNFGNVSEIAKEFESVVKISGPEVPFFLIENHGVTVWGKNVRDANKNLEAAEILMQIMCGRRNKITA